MSALFASAQIWVPAAGLAALLLVRAWLSWQRKAPVGTAAVSYFLSFGLAIVVPNVAAVIAWALHGGAMQWGPILLGDTADAAERHVLLAALVSPALAFLIARFIFSAADAVAYAASAAAAFALAHFLSPPVVFAAALGVGALVGFADQMLGKTAMAMSSTTAFALLFGLAYAHRGPAIPLITLSLVGGLCLSLFAAAGKRARFPLYMLLAFVPALILAAILKDRGALDLSARLSLPAVGICAALIVLLVVFPAAAAPFTVLPAWFGARARRLGNETLQLLAAPFAVAVEILIGAAASAALAFALTAGGAVFDHIHRAMGGVTLLRMSALIGEIRASPLGPSNAWLIALLILPFVPGFVRALDWATSAFSKLVEGSGFADKGRSAVQRAGWGVRLLTTVIGRIFQLAPAAVILFAIAKAGLFAADRYGEQFRAVGDAIILACDRTARGVEDLQVSAAAFCLTGGPSCK